MQQTFYIESDEEIISVIGKLRKSTGMENYFVFPKRALVLQSIVNLRLLQREAEKLGKRLIIVTQDEIGKNLAQKVGLETENYSDDFAAESRKLELKATMPVSSPSTVPVTPPLAAPPIRAVPRSDTIGSSEYNTGLDAPAPDLSVPSATSGEGEKRLRIRNASPEKLTALNSKRVLADGPKPAPPAPGFSPPAYFAPSRSSVTPPAAATVEQSASPRPHPGSAQIPQARDERLEKFFAPPAPQAPTPPARTPAEPQGRATRVSHESGRKQARGIFFVIGALAFLSLMGAGFYLFFPKAEVRVTPFQTSRVVNQEYTGTTGTFVAGERTLPVRIVEKEKEIALTVATTGTSTNSNQKARGSLTIYNNFSADPQPLVATTRFEDPEGRVFRLVQSVTVPGMSGAEAGSVQAEVIADQSGSAYNIAPTTFTVPGFQGSPKYEKFSARSSAAMIGGGDGGSELAAVAQADLDQASSQARDQAKSDFLAEAQSELESGEKILEEHLEITTVGEVPTPAVGTLASSFEYRNKYRVRAFVIPEASIREEMMDRGGTTIENITFVPESAVLTYENSSPNFPEGRLSLNVRALLSLESEIAEADLHQAVLGKNSQGIEGVLAEFPGIKKIEVRFDPQGLVSTVPKDADRVTIIREEGEE